LINGGFDVDLTGWGDVAPNVEPIWSSDDSEGCAGSGSVHGENTGGSPDKCVVVSANTRYFFGAKFKSDNSFQHCDIGFYPNADCTGTVDVSHPAIALPAGGPNWTSVSTIFVTPNNTRSLFLSCFLFQGNMDQIYLNASVNAF
jgi:hypothetical protein